MKKFFSLLVMCMFVTICSAQNWYVGTSFGFDINLDSGRNTNNGINLNVGYFMDNNQALEVEYTHGFQKDFVYYNRIGLNYVFEFETHTMAAPYLKLGMAYKNYGIKDFDVNEGFCDVKAAVGFRYYFNPDIAVDLGVNFTNGYNSDVSWNWRNTNMQLSLGFAYNF